MAGQPEIVDPVGDTLHFLRMSGVFYCRSEFTAPFALDLPAFDASMMFHVATSGQCRLVVEGAAPHLLRPGGLALVPHGQGHRLCSEPDAAATGLFDAPRELVSDRYETLKLGGGGPASTVVCGVVRFDHPAAHHLTRLLPRLITVDAWSAPELEWIQSTLRFMAIEAREPRAGGEAVITRLADILVIQAIRDWIARDPSARHGWLGALRDPQIGRAMALVHRNPGGNWTLSSLASCVGMSRSAFAARFTRIVGEPAMRYVARWQMEAARMWLEEDAASPGDVASRLGYESDAAFSRAFKRFIGVPPGAIRRQTRARGCAARSSPVAPAPISATRPVPARRVTIRRPSLPARASSEPPMTAVETIKAAYAAFARNDPSVLFGAMDAGVTWNEAEGNPLADRNPYVGAQAIGEGVFARLLGAIDAFTAVPSAFIDGGDDVVVLGRYGGTMKGSGATLDAQFCHVYHFRDGKVVSFQQYTDTAQWARLMA